jgi:hypothetical protein
LALEFWFPNSLVEIVKCGEKLTQGSSWQSYHPKKTLVYTLWLFNIAMENCPFIDGLPIKNGDFPWLCQITRWYILWLILPDVQRAITIATF